MTTQVLPINTTPDNSQRVSFIKCLPMFLMMTFASLASSGLVTAVAMALVYNIFHATFFLQWPVFLVLLMAALLAAWYMARKDAYTDIVYSLLPYVPEPDTPQFEISENPTNNLKEAYFDLLVNANRLDRERDEIYERYMKIPLPFWPLGFTYLNAHLQNLEDELKRTRFMSRVMRHKVAVRRMNKDI